MRQADKEETGLAPPMADGRGFVPAPGMDADAPPVLLVVVDTEEEFDWNKPFSPSEVAVSSMAAQEAAQRILESHGLRPVYAVDYPIVDTEEGYAWLRERHAAGLIDIGAQMHPWVNPPRREEISFRNSFAGNLPRELERAKIASLTERIGEVFGTSPVFYKAGRYGFGPNTAGILLEQGYLIDGSSFPTRDFRHEGGPDYTAHPVAPYWIRAGSGALLELPRTAAVTGLLSSWAARLFPLIATPAGERLRLPGICSRLGLMNRITLTPEGVSLEEAKLLTRHLLARGQRVFHLSYHSPSLVPGHTPYVRSDKDLEAFLRWLDEYIAFFLHEAGGVAMPLDEIYAAMQAAADNAAKRVS